jgi:hypothetical protein
MSRKPPQLKFGIEEVLTLLMLVGNSAWIYPWVAATGPWLDPTGRPALGPVAVVGLLTLAMLATRLLTLSPRLLSAGRILLPVMGLLAAGTMAVAGLPAFATGGSANDLAGQLLSGETGVRTIGSAVIAAAIWWRGIQLGRVPPNMSLIEDQMRTGVVGLCALLSMSALAGHAAAVSDRSLLLPTLLFLATSLLEMPLASVIEVSESPRNRGGQRLSPGGSWLTMMLSIVGGLLAVTLLLAQLLTFQRIEQVWDAVREPVSALLESAVYLLAIPVSLVIQFLVFLISLLPTSNKEPKPQVDPLKALSQMQEQAVSGQISPEVIMVLKVVIAVGLALLFLWLVARALSRLGRGWRDEDVEESRDILWEWGWLFEIWRSLLARLHPARRLVAAARAGIHGNGAQPGSVRALYWEFLILGAKQGRGRRPAETPLEYERRLAADPTLPCGDELRTITGGYLRARYAPPTSATPEPGPVASALERLRDLWRSRRQV